MKTIALLSQKGGSSKTSLTISLACAAEERGKSTLIIDLDPQATVCKWGDRRQAESPIVIDAQPARLANALAKAREGGIEIAVIDTPPRSAEAALAAAKLADLIVLPCRPQMYDLETVPNALELITTARAGRGNIPLLAVLSAVPAQGTRHDQAKRAIEGHRQVGSLLGQAGSGSRTGCPRPLVPAMPATGSRPRSSATPSGSTSAFP